MVRQKRDGFAVRVCAAATAAASVQRLKRLEPLAAGRRDGQARENSNDAVELEGPQCAWVHGFGGTGRRRYFRYL